MKHERIEINPEIMLGKPVIKGTRITVELVLRRISSGQSIDQIMKSYPNLTPDDIYAAVAFAADYIADEDSILV